MEQGNLEWGKNKKIDTGKLEVESQLQILRTMRTVLFELNELRFKFSELFEENIPNVGYTPEMNQLQEEIKRKEAELELIHIDNKESLSTDEAIEKEMIRLKALE
jgi:hypothetical protein